MTGPFYTPGRVKPALQRPPLEALGLLYLTPFMGATPVATRLPNPAQNADTINGFLRLESGGGVQCNLLEFDMTLLIHAYALNEVLAEQICDAAMPWLGAAEGQQIDGWSITRVVGTIEKHKLGDPNVQKLTRYRAGIRWRMPGRVLAPPGS